MDEYNYDRSPSNQYILLRDGTKVADGNEGEIWRWIHKNTSTSVSYALEYGGYQIIPVENIHT